MKSSILAPIPKITISMTAATVKQFTIGSKINNQSLSRMPLCLNPSLKMCLYLMPK